MERYLDEAAACLPIEVYRNVEVDDVTVHYGTAVRNAMADHFVGGDTHRLREGVVVEGGGVRVALHARRVNDAVNLVASDSDLS